MKIIDAHHHLWQYNKADYGWMDPSMTILKKDYIPTDLYEEINKAGVKGTVVVQARQNEEETAWLLTLAEDFDFIKGVVGWMDLQSDDLPEQLELISGNPKLVGLRHVIHDEPDVDFMLKSDFLRGIGYLAANNLAYDLLIFPEHLSNTEKLVSKFPEQRFVLDHIAKPPINAGKISSWKKGIARLASHPNVYCKISGMVTEADHVHWQYEDFVPYLDVVTENFGTDRLMVGSDWPVCRLAAEYGQVLDIPKRYFADLDEGQQEDIFKNNCIKFYQLDD